MADATLSCDAALRIDSGHPAFPGHFPGQPIAPGVLILDLVLSHAERWLGRPLRVNALVQAKFMQPLRPDQDARLQLTLKGDDLRFTITSDGASIAHGLFRLAGEQPR